MELKISYLIFFLCLLNSACKQSISNLENDNEIDSLTMVKYADSILLCSTEDMNNKQRDLFFVERKKLTDSFLKITNGNPIAIRDSVIWQTRLAYSQVQPEIRYLPVTSRNKFGEKVEFLKVKNFDLRGGVKGLEKFLNDTINRNIIIPKSKLNSQSQYVCEISFKISYRMQELKITTDSACEQFQPLMAEYSRLFHIAPMGKQLAIAQKNSISEDYVKSQKDFNSIRLLLSIDTNLNISVTELYRSSHWSEDLKKLGYDKLAKNADSLIPWRDTSD